eukprot:GEMP01053300.1.p1 GENE.GEMP01053300.1~~GEMP01053300.1.p1  ORF type:complete len:372 (+),score=70.27 GEMP01053300.1:126-1118(+)
MREIRSLLTPKEWGTFGLSTRDVYWQSTANRRATIGTILTQISPHATSSHRNSATRNAPCATPLNTTNALSSPSAASSSSTRAPARAATTARPPTSGAYGHVPLQLSSRRTLDLSARTSANNASAMSPRRMSPRGVGADPAMPSSAGTPRQDLLTRLISTNVRQKPCEEASERASSVAATAQGGRVAMHVENDRGAEEYAVMCRPKRAVYGYGPRVAKPFVTGAERFGKPETQKTPRPGAYAGPVRSSPRVGGINGPRCGSIGKEKRHIGWAPQEAVGKFQPPRRAHASWHFGSQAHPNIRGGAIARAPRRLICALDVMVGNHLWCTVVE